AGDNRLGGQPTLAASVTPHTRSYYARFGVTARRPDCVPGRRSCFIRQSVPAQESCPHVVPLEPPRPPPDRPGSFRRRLEALEDRSVPTAGVLDTSFGGTGMKTLPNSVSDGATATVVQ